MRAASCLDLLDELTHRNKAAQRTVLERLFGVSMQTIDLSDKDIAPLETLLVKDMPLLEFVLDTANKHAKTAHALVEPLVPKLPPRRLALDTIGKTWSVVSNTAKPNNTHIQQALALSQAVQKTETDTEEVAKLKTELCAMRNDAYTLTEDVACTYDALLVLVQACAYRSSKAAEKASSIHRHALYSRLLFGKEVNATQTALMAGDIPYLKCMQLANVSLTQQEMMIVSNILAKVQCTNSIDKDEEAFRKALLADERLGPRVVDELQRVGLLPN